MNFSNFGEHSSPPFKLLNIVKLCDLVRFHTSVFMFKFYNSLLPPESLITFSLLSKAFILTIHGQQQISHITYLKRELIMDSIIVGLKAQKCGIQLEKTLKRPV